MNLIPVKYYFTSLSFFLFVHFFTNAQSVNPTGIYKHFTIDDGLSNNSITSIIQDEYGFIWIGTANGLNRFDGYNFIHYKNKPGDSSSISNNYINSLCLDKKGNLWIATNNGLNCYNLKTETFFQYRHKTNDPTTIADAQAAFVYEDKKGHIWVGTAQTLDRLDPATGVFTHYSPAPINTPYDSKAVTDIIEYRNDLYISVWGIGAFRFNRAYETFSPVDIFHKEKSKQSWIYNFRLDQKGHLLAVDGHFMKYDTTIGAFKHADINSTEDKNLSIDCISQVNKDTYIAGSVNSAFYIYNADMKVRGSYFLDMDTSVINRNSIHVLFTAKNGQVWLGTTSNGIFEWNTNLKKFEGYKTQADLAGSISAGAISSILFSKSGSIWTGSNLNGVAIFNPGKKTFEAIKQKGLSSPYIRTLFEDRQGNKWIGTWAHGGGLNKIDAKTGKISCHKQSTNGANVLPADFISDVCQSPDGRIWVATTLGLAVIDERTKKPIVKSFPFHPHSNKSPAALRTDVLLCDHTGNIWIGTDMGGLSRYNPASDLFDHFDPDKNGLGANKVNCLFEDSKKRLWVGCSGGGLNVFVPAKNNFIRYDEKDGLPGNEIKGIIEDNNGFLWITTDKGLCRFDTDRKTFLIYNVADGLLSNQFYPQAIAKNPRDGKIFAGTINGLVSFYPDSIVSNTFIPPVYITSCKAYHTNGKQTISRFIGAVQHQSSIKLGYAENTFTLSFVSLDYTNNVKNQYAYKIKESGNNWVYLGNTRELTFSNLPPGTYTLTIKASNSDLVWNEKGTTLIIEILPPWWLTWWAYACYGIAIVLVTWWFIHYRVRSKMQKQIALQFLRTKISSDLHDDVGSLLSGLSMQSQMLAYKAKEEQKTSLLEISSMGRDAMERMRDAVWVIDGRKDKYENLLDRMRAFAEKNLAMKNMTCEFNVANVIGKKFIDPEKRQSIYLIFREAITNIVKHSDGSHVVITFTNTKNNLHLIIHDNGCKRKTCNSDGVGLSNMKMRAEKIGGRLSHNYDNGFVVELQIP